MSNEPAPAAANVPALDKRKSIILGIIGLAFIVLIFWKVIPSLGSYEVAFAQLRAMGWGAIIGIVLAVLLYLGLYGLTFPAATKGLGYWQGQQLNQAAFAISNGVPGGGAVGLAVQYGMLASYKIAPAAATASITTVGLWSTFVTLAFPVLGVIALILGGANGGAYVTVAAIGLAILIAGVVLLVLVVRSERLARALGRGANKIARPLTKRVKKLSTLDLEPAIVNFRGSIYYVVAKRWLPLTGAQMAIFFGQFLIFFVALRGAEGWGNSGAPFLVVFGAFAVAQIGLMIPITPGGVGTVDAIMISILGSWGDSHGMPGLADTATAADIVWRMASFLPQIFIGVIALVTWYRRAGRTFAVAKPKTTEATH